jgi:hypothetical protein
VTVFDGTNQIGTTTANGSGAWRFTSGILPNGNHNFTAEAADGDRQHKLGLAGCGRQV